MIDFEDFPILTKIAESKEYKINRYGITLDSGFFIEKKEAQKWIEPGFITSKYNRSPKLKENLQAIADKLNILKKGIPIEKKKEGNPDRVALSKGKWLTGQVRKVSIVGNGEFIYMGKPITLMKAEKAPVAFRQNIISGLIGRELQGSWFPIYPIIFQADGILGINLIWLADETQDFMVAIQTKYYDFLKHRFPSGTFYAKKENDTLCLKVRHKGIKGYVALVKPYSVEVKGCSLSRPKKLENWKPRKAGKGEEMPDKKMS